MEKRYKEKPDKKIYTAQIMKLLDEHVIVGHITKTEAVNIFDDEMFEQYKRLSDSDLLNRVKKIRAEFKNDVPSELGTNKTIITFYRKSLSFLQNQKDQNQPENAIQIALDTYDIIKQKIIVHWTKNTFILNKKFT
ncbi:hypothetical protein O6R16_05695 [Candidatus Rickettsia tasmanensis]